MPQWSDKIDVKFYNPYRVNRLNRMGFWLIKPSNDGYCVDPFYPYYMAPNKKSAEQNLFFYYFYVKLILLMDSAMNEREIVADIC